MPKIQMRRDTAANWESVNPTLLSGEWALETDSRRMKIGDGTTAYNSLPYYIENGEWQKPSDWFDMRSGALTNSVYFLVGHSADYSIYPEFSVKPTISSSGTYDVFVDGVKKATTASGTATVLNWQTLALSSGFDVTTPSALRAHIVRVTPTTHTNSISAISTEGATSNVRGILWVHFTTKTALSLLRLLGQFNTFTSPICQAVTATGNELQVTSLSNAFAGASSLACTPVLVGNSTSQDHAFSFQGTPIKKVIIKNLIGNFGQAFNGCTQLEKIDTTSCEMQLGNASFRDCAKLQELPSDSYYGTANSGLINNYLNNCTSLKPTMLDLTECSSNTRLVLGGTSTARLDGIKRVLVSSSAPYNNASSPQIDVSYTGLDRQALVDLFTSMPTVTDSQVINITGATGAANLDATDLAIATGKGWTVTR